MNSIDPLILLVLNGGVLNSLGTGKELAAREPELHLKSHRPSYTSDNTS